MRIWSPLLDCCNVKGWRIAAACSWCIRCIAGFTAGWLTWPALFLHRTQWRFLDNGLQLHLHFQMLVPVCAWAFTEMNMLLHRWACYFFIMYVSHSHLPGHMLEGSNGCHARVLSCSHVYYGSQQKTCPEHQYIWPAHMACTYVVAHLELEQVWPAPSSVIASWSCSQGQQLAAEIVVQSTTWDTRDQGLNNTLGKQQSSDHSSLILVIYAPWMPALTNANLILCYQDAME